MLSDLDRDQPDGVTRQEVRLLGAEERRSALLPAHVAADTEGTTVLGVAARVDAPA